MRSDLPEQIYLEITRSMVECRDTAALLFALRAMTLGAGSLRRYASSVRLMFSGYDADPRELYAIPEVRGYVYRLTQDFPYWLHFADKNSASLLVLLMCLTSVDSTENSAGRVTSGVDVQGLKAAVQDLFIEMNTLHARHGLSPSETSAMTQQVSDYLRQHFVPIPE
jgi:hypothetical protein